ncbi:MAG: hypothetical protein QM605_11390 [Sphingobium sp.]
MLPLAVILLQAALPPPGLPYDARTDYAGPGLLCGAAFSIRLEVGESAVLIKRSFVDAEMDVHLREGRFTVHESQYAVEGGDPVRRMPEGILRRKREKGRTIWIYRDAAPGSTEVHGPAVDSIRPGPLLNRIRFGAPRAERCLTGKGSGRRSG